MPDPILANDAVEMNAEAANHQGPLVPLWQSTLDQTLRVPTALDSGKQSPDPQQHLPLSNNDGRPIRQSCACSLKNCKHQFKQIDDLAGTQDITFGIVDDVYDDYGWNHKLSYITDATLKPKEPDFATSAPWVNDWTSTRYTDMSLPTSNEKQSNRSMTGAEPVTQESIDHEDKSLKDDVPALIFACPYAKYDPMRYSASNLVELHYRGCGQCFLTDISRLKQHLYRVHERPQHYCSTCYSIFKTGNQARQHTKLQCCKPQPCPFDEKMTTEQFSFVKRRNRGIVPEQSWYDIYAMLFPGMPTPRSPYATFAEDGLGSGSDSISQHIESQVLDVLQQSLKGSLDEETLAQISSKIKSSFSTTQRDKKKDFDLAKQEVLSLRSSDAASPKSRDLGDNSVPAGNSMPRSDKTQNEVVLELERTQKRMSATEWPQTEHNSKCLTANDNRMNLLDTIDQFYALCKECLRLAKGVRVVTATNNGTHSSGQASGNQGPSMKDRNSFSHPKRKLDADIPFRTSNKSGNDEYTVVKRPRIEAGDDSEYPCWWFLKDPIRYQACARNCSRKRTLHSYRRHHFDDHWRWGDVHYEGISEETWHAAKHASYRDMSMSAEEKAKLKWIQTYRILFGLNEVDTVPDPICSEVNHVFCKPKRPIRMPLPSKNSDSQAGSSSSTIETTLPSDQSNWTTEAAADLSFLDPIVDKNDVFFTQLDYEELGDPTSYDFEAALDDRSFIAKDLLEISPPTDRLTALVQDSVHKLKSLLESMQAAPRLVSSATFQQICNHVTDFEKRYNHMILSSAPFPTGPSAENRDTLLAWQTTDVNQIPQFASYDDDLTSKGTGPSTLRPFPVTEAFEFSTSSGSHSDDKPRESDDCNSPETPDWGAENNDPSLQFFYQLSDSASASQDDDIALVQFQLPPDSVDRLFEPLMGGYFPSSTSGVLLQYDESKSENRARYARK